MTDFSFEIVVEELQLYQETGSIVFFIQKNFATFEI